VVEALKGAQGVVAFHQTIQEKLLGEIPELHGSFSSDHPGKAPRGNS
jgi:hypothetical protein